MKLSTLLECIALVAAAHAATFKMPIISLAHERSPSLSKARVAAMIEAGESRARRELSIKEQNTRRHRSSQPTGSGPIGVVENDGKYMDFIKASSTLQPPPIEPENSKRALPLWYWEELTYTTPIRIGTPPQPLNLLLSLSSASLFIPSSTCTACFSANSYIAIKSSTHIRHNAAFTSSSHLFHSRGNLCYDTIRLSSNPTTTIETQIFGEMEEMERYLPWSEESWDGALGLAPGSGSEMGVLNNLMNQGLLDKNVFSLRLPRGRGERGEILFGDVDHDLYVGNLKSLQLVEEEKGRWAVAATGLSVNDREGLVLELNGGTAVFETDFPFIGLPEKYVRILDKKLGMKNAGKEWGWVRSVDCSRRKLMQNITIGLGGEEFVVSPWEYTVEADMGDLSGGRRCVSAFVPNEDEGMDVVLGSVFLRAFYGVFDLDRRTVSCEYSFLGRPISVEQC
ncbi:acid protease [Hyaloscypha variabilis]